MNRLRTRLVAIALGVSALAAWAQPAALVRADKADPEALVDLLAIPDPKASDDLTRRGLRPAPPGKPNKRYGPGRANLLVTFVTGSSELAPEAKSLLDALGRAMQADALAGVSFKVQGHADARGKASDNDALSLARAEAVVGYLKANHAVLPDRLKAEGLGSRHPMNAARVDAPENRRVTVVSVR